MIFSQKAGPEASVLWVLSTELLCPRSQGADVKGAISGLGARRRRHKR